MNKIHTFKRERSPRTHDSELRRTSQPPTSTTAWIRTTAANRPSGILPLSNTDIWVFNLCTNTELSLVSDFVEEPSWVDKIDPQPKASRWRVGVMLGRCDVSVVESKWHKALRSAGTDISVLLDIVRWHVSVLSEADSAGTIRGRELYREPRNRLNEIICDMLDVAQIIFWNAERQNNLLAQ